MNALQCKMARAALGLGVRDLALLANVAQATVSRFERGEDLKESTVISIRTALEAAGVIFVDSNGEGEGVRMRKFKKGDQVRLVSGTKLWGEHQALRDQVGTVVEEVKDGTSMLRISVAFEGREPVIGAGSGLFEFAGVRPKGAST